MKSTTNTGDGEDGKIKGSKQKIFQLKEELNGGHLGINPKFEKLKVLRESYDIAKFRANELLQPHEQNLYIKVHGQRASKIYSALSTLIFLSISTSKVEELEHYIRNAASQVPSSIFDLEEWNSIVKIAKDCREGDYSLLQERSRVMRKNMQIFYQLAVNPLRTAQMELKLLKSEISNELSNAKVELASSINLVMQIIAELQSTGTLGESAEKLGNLIREHTDTSARSPLAKQKDEELLAAKTALQQANEAAEQERKAFNNERAELQGQLEESTLQRAKQTAEKEQLSTLLAERDRQAEEMTSRLQEQEKLIAEQDAAITALREAEAKVKENASQQHAHAQLVRDFEELAEQHRIVAADLERREDMVATLKQELHAHQLQKKTTEEVSKSSAAHVGELNAAQRMIAELRAEVEELRRRVVSPRSEKAVVATAQVVSNPVVSAAPAAAEERAALSVTPPLCIARNSEEDELLSLIAAEAIHAASAAVSAAAGKLVASLSSATAEEAMHSAVALQAELLESILVHNEILSRSGSLSSISPREMESISGKLSAPPVSVAVSAEQSGSPQAPTEEEFVMSLIAAEAIHTASLAVTAAAAKLVAGLANETAQAPSVDLQALQVSLADTLVAQEGVLRSPKLGEASPPAPPAESPSTPSRVHFRTQDSVREVTRYIDTGSTNDMSDYVDKEGFDEEEDENEDVLSLIYAEAMHTASAAVMEAAARLIASMTSVAPSDGKDRLPVVLDLQETLADKLVAHTEVLLSPKMASLSSKIPSFSSPDLVEASAKLKSGGSPKKAAQVAEDGASGEELVLSLISAEAIHTASAAVTEAAAHLLRSLSSGSEPEKVVALHAALADSLAAHSEAVSHPQMVPAKEFTVSASTADAVQAPAEAAQEAVQMDECADTEISEKAAVETVVAGEELPALDVPLTPEAVPSPAAEATVDAVADECVLQAVVAEAKPDEVATEEIKQAEAVPVVVSASVAAEAATADPAPLAADSTSVATAPSVAEPVVSVDPSPVGATTITDAEDTATTTVTPNEALSALDVEPAPVAADPAEGVAVAERPDQVSQSTSAVVPSPKAATEVEPPASEKAKPASDVAATGSTKSAPILTSATEEEVVIVQNQMRSFIARAKVRRVRAEKEAAKQGVLSAAKGTVQGEPGWYKTNDQLFYFCMDQKEYVLLGGPVDEELYEAAAGAEKAGKRGDTVLSVSRVGLRATRLQIDSLTAQVTALEGQHAQLLSELEDQQLQSEVALEEARAETQKLVSEIAECRAMLRTLETDRRRSLLSRGVSEVVKAKAAALSLAQAAAIVKLTSAVRGFLGRVRVKKIKTAKLALEVGILSAMTNTIQGQSGWYMGPNRAIFYFVLKNKEWINIAGPISAEDYELLLLSRKQKQVSYSGEVLTRCSLELVPDKMVLLERGEIYLENVSDKLYLCTPLDSVVEGRVVGVPRGASTDEADAKPLSAQKTVAQKGAILIRQESKSLGPSMPAEREARPVSEKVELVKFVVEEV